MIYLDHNATAILKPAVMDEVMRVMRAGGNPSSVHRVGRGAKAILEQARGNIAKAINSHNQQIIFTSGGTEANNMALNITGMDHMIIAATEHDSILQSRQKFSGNLDILPVDAQGYVSADDLQDKLAQASGHILVSIMLANNESGVIQDIQKLSRIAHEHGALFHCDAIQAFGKIALDFKELAVDMMSLSSHKICGPQGVGALVAREKIDIESLTTGGGQEKGRRAGTENLAGIAGFAKAASLLPDNLNAMQGIKKLRDHIEQSISSHAPDAYFFGADSDRLPNTTTILMPGVASEIQVMAFDLEGICVSSGSACSSGKVKPSHVVTAMGGSQEQALSTIRVSLGWNSTAQEVETFISAWKKLYDRKR